MKTYSVLNYASRDQDVWALEL